jgi:hypothetical protein
VQKLADVLLNPDELLDRGAKDDKVSNELDGDENPFVVGECDKRGDVDVVEEYKGLLSMIAWSE